jgi:hypothetical protein
MSQFELIGSSTTPIAGLLARFTAISVRGFLGKTFESIDLLGSGLSRPLNDNQSQKRVRGERDSALNTELNNCLKQLFVVKSVLNCRTWR